MFSERMTQRIMEGNKCGTQKKDPENSSPKKVDWKKIPGKKVP